MTPDPSIAKPQLTMDPMREKHQGLKTAASSNWQHKQCHPTTLLVHIHRPERVPVDSPLGQGQGRTNLT